MESGDLAEKLSFVYARFRSHDALAGLALEYGLYDCAHESLVAAETHFDPLLGAFNRGSLDLGWVQWSIGMDRWNDARNGVTFFEPLDLSNRSRHHLLQAAAKLRVLMHDGQDEDARTILSALLGWRGALFRHSSVDHIAVAVALGLARYQGQEEASRFASEFLTTNRRDLMPPPSELLGLAR